MGIDSQLIADRTYVIVEHDGVLAGCGGWSGRITEYGGAPVPLVRMGKRLDDAGL